MIRMRDTATFAPLGRSIGRTHKFARALGDRALADLGSSVTEWIVLSHIANAPKPGKRIWSNAATGTTTSAMCWLPALGPGP